MKNVLRIARTEIRLLFYSPIAWLLLFAFFLQLGLSYFNVIELWASAQEKGGYYLMDLRDLTYQTFSLELFGSIMNYLYMYLPLITMGLISRETSSGTIRLLYSSPVTPLQIVLGKYLSVVFFGLAMMAVIVIFVVSGAFHIRHADVGILITGSIGFFLVICTYASIGLFMSSITSYQIIAALASMMTIAALTYIGEVWQQFELVRKITYYLNIEGHTDHLMTGLITTSDIMYFVAIIYIFLGFTYLRIKGGMESRPFSVKAARVVLVLATGITLGMVFSRPAVTKYLDLSADQRNTLTPQLQDIVKQMDSGKLEITTYGNVMEKTATYMSLQYRNRIKSLWDNYLRFKPDIDLNFTNYYARPIPHGFLSGPNLMFGLDTTNKTFKQQAQDVAEALELDFDGMKSSEELKHIVDLEPELNRYVMELKYKGRSTFLRVFEDRYIYPLEPEVGAAFSRLLLKKTPKVYYVTGHYERSLDKLGNREYRLMFIEKTARKSLINNGFDTDTINIENNDIPLNADIVVIADPKAAFSNQSIQRLEKYISDGGNLVVAGEPGKQEILNPLMKKLGVQFMDGMFVQPTRDYSPDIFKQFFTPSGVSISLLMKYAYDQKWPLESKSAMGISFKDTGNFTMQPLVLTDPATTWLKKQVFEQDAVTPSFNASAGDSSGAIPAVVSLTRKINNKEQRIVVCGDADFMDNELSNYDFFYANYALGAGIFKWLNYGVYPIEAQRPLPKDNRVNVSLDRVDLLRIPYTWVLPGLLVIAGAIVLIRRKRK